MKVGDLVRWVYTDPDVVTGCPEDTGIVIKTNISMRGEEVIPSGIEVLWSDDETEIYYEDELEVISEIIDNI